MLKHLALIAINRKWFFVALGALFLIANLSPPAPMDHRGMAVIGIAVMAIILFVTSAIPLPATALLIAFFQVFFKVGTPNQIARAFSGEVMLFIMGILLISNALISQNIDKHLARILLNLTGLKTSRVLFGCMLLAVLLAGFIGEHTTAALLFPVVLSLIATVRGSKEQKNKLAKLLLIGLAYSAMIGGMGTPAGGARNPLMMEYLWRMYGIKVSYFQWVVMSLPIALLLLPVLFIVLRATFRTSLSVISSDVSDFLGREQNESPKLPYSEKVTLAIFILILLMWMLFSSTIGMGIIALLGVLLYLLSGVTTWNEMARKTNWGVVLVYGSALSLGLAMKQTGVTTWLANLLSDGMYHLHITQKPLVLGFVGLSSAILSNFLSHAPSLAVSAPIFLKLGAVVKADILVLGMVNAITCSFGFLMVIASPANALIFTSGYLKPADFLKAGLLLTFTFVALTVLLSIFYWGILGYNL